VSAAANRCASVYISTIGDAPETSGIRQTQTAGGKIDTVRNVHQPLVSGN
jgi:hypothetical protein